MMSQSGPKTETDAFGGEYLVVVHDRGAYARESVRMSLSLRPRAAGPVSTSG